MDRTEFDKFADAYRSLHQANIAASGEAPEYFAEYKIRDLRALLSRERVACEVGRFLDFGAGIGTSVPFFRKYFPDAQVSCVDVSLKSLGIGVSRFPTQARFVAFDGTHLPFADAAFDCAFAACVFHHIPIEEHRPLFKEICRVLKPGGRVLIYEHNPLNPLTVRAVNTCSFDENSVLVPAWRLQATLKSAGFQSSRVRYRVFFPRALRWLRGLEDFLGWLPLGAQYYVFGKK